MVDLLFVSWKEKELRSLVAARRHWVSKSPNGAPHAAAAARVVLTFPSSKILLNISTLQGPSTINGHS